MEMIGYANSMQPLVPSLTWEMHCWLLEWLDVACSQNKQEKTIEDI